jgi:hypothetical protein
MAWAEGRVGFCGWSGRGTAHAVSESNLVRGRGDARSWFVSKHGDGFELGVVVSCGTCVRKGRRTELDLGRGEPFDHSHRSTTARAGPESESRRSPWRGVGHWVRLRRSVQYLRTEWQERGAAAVGQIAEIANANKAGRKQMQEEAA